jgi:hypothetical protein
VEFGVEIGVVRGLGLLLFREQKSRHHREAAKKAADEGFVIRSASPGPGQKSDPDRRSASVNGAGWRARQHRRAPNGFHGDAKARGGGERSGASWRPLDHEFRRIRDAAVAIPGCYNLPVGDERLRSEFARFDHLKVALIVDVANAIARPQWRLLW